MHNELDETVEAAATLGGGVRRRRSGQRRLTNHHSPIVHEWDTVACRTPQSAHVDELVVMVLAMVVSILVVCCQGNWNRQCSEQRDCDEAVLFSGFHLSSRQIEKSCPGVGPKRPS